MADDAEARLLDGCVLAASRNGNGGCLVKLLKTVDINKTDLTPALHAAVRSGKRTTVRYY